MSATDEEILEAAHAVMARRGSNGFTVSEVAREVGLSRAAIIQRFKGVDELRTILIKQLSTTFEEALAQLKAEPGAAGLIEIAEFIGRWTGGRAQFSAFLLDYSARITDRDRREMETRRGVALRAAVGRVMPPLAVEPEAAVNAFMANVTGSLLAWQSIDHPDAAGFLRERARQWLKLVGIAETEQE